MFALDRVCAVNSLIGGYLKKIGYACVSCVYRICLSSRRCQQTQVTDPQGKQCCGDGLS